MNEEKQDETLWVSGLVAARDGTPYVVLSRGEKTVAQLTCGAAFNLAKDLIQAASRTEADAMLVRFFQSVEFPDSAAVVLMQQFRDFRAEIDAEDVRRRD